jgi:hypothetical protein
MITTAMKRAMSTETKLTNYTRVIKYIGANTNVASHNDERREAYKGKFNFKDSWGLGVEGFSHGAHLPDMNPLTGSRGELMWLLALLVVIPVIAFGRKNNEEGVAAVLGSATNKYAKLDLDIKSASIDTTIRL